MSNPKKESWKTKEEWLQTHWGDLILDPEQKLPEAWGNCCKQVFRFKCLGVKLDGTPCGKTRELRFAPVQKGDYSCCGRCNFYSKEYWLVQTWGELRLNRDQNLPEEIPVKCNKKFLFDCSCGREPLEMIFSKLTLGNYTSCGKCSVRSKEYWLDKRWGKDKCLQLDPDQTLKEEWHEQCNDRLKFICSCGRKVENLFVWVSGGNTTSCGKCSFKPKEYWLQQQWGFLILDPDQELPEEWGPGSDQRFTFICKNIKKDGEICNKKLIPSFYDITSHGYRSCGCAAVGKGDGSEANLIYREIVKIYPDALEEYTLAPPRKFRLDIYIPSLSLGIEWNGLISHSERWSDGDKKKKDYEKYLLCLEKGIRLIQIYGDENWKLILEFLLKKDQKRRIKPIYRFGTFEEVSKFLSEKHYLGGENVGGTHYIVATSGEKIIGAWVFKKRDLNNVEWTRACWDHDFQAWNPHQEALKMILDLGIYEKVISYSDNRLHTGDLYQKLGFRLDGEVAPSPSYTNFRIRKHKTNFKVPAGVDEVEEAKKMGYWRIWDSGKKRWILDIK